LYSTVQKFPYHYIYHVSKIKQILKIKAKKKEKYINETKQTNKNQLPKMATADPTAIPPQIKFKK
jgi:hypothetical protein